jgi:hypothetical protein
LGYRCAQGRRLDLVDNCFWWHLGDFGALANVRFAPEAAVPRGRVVSVMTRYPVPTGGLFVVRPPGQHSTRKVRVLTELLIEHFG